MSFSDWVKEKKRKEEREGNTTYNVPSSPKVGSFSEWVTARKEASNVNQDYINSFYTDAKAYLESANADYDKVGWGNASTIYDSKNSTWEDLNKRYQNISMWLYQNKDKVNFEAYRDIGAALDSYRSGVNSVKDAFKSATDFYAQFETEDAYNEWRKTEDEKQAVLSAKDFKEKSQYVSTTNDTLYNWLNDKDDYRLKYEDQVATRDMDGNIVSYGSSYVKNGYEFISPEEVNIYNYYYSTQGKERAKEYLDSLSDTLTQRQAGNFVETFDETSIEWLFSLYAGVDMFASGIKNLDNLIMGTEADPTTAAQYAYAQTSSNNTGFRKVVNDLANTTGNMLPSILVGTVTGGVGGAATMGLSAAGNGYAEMRNLGYDENQARVYAALVAASEAGLQYVLGGISPLGSAKGGLVSKATTKALGQVDNALARFAISVGANMLDEGFEEAAQSVLEPIFKHIVTLGEEDINIDWGEVAYSALLGALSAGMLEGVPTAIGTTVSNVQAKKVYGDGSALVNEALGVATEGSELATRANKYKSKLDSGKSLSGQQINLLNDAIASNDTNIIKKAAKERLAELGETGDIDKIADVIAKIRTAENIGTRRVNTQAYNKELYELAAQISGSNTTPLSKLSDKEITDVSGKVSDSGTTKNTSTGEDVIINQDNAIAKTKMVNGERVVYYNTDKGVVASTDIKYATKGEGLLYEAFVDLNPAFANAVIKNYDGSVPIETYVKGMREGIVVYGMHNFQAVGKDISGASHLAELSKADQDFALKLGRAYAKADAKKADNNLHKAIKNAADKAEASDGKSTSKTQKKGRVSFENGAKLKTKAQRRVAALAKHLASAIGIDIVFYDATISGTPGSDSNGYYDPDTDTIHLDLQNAKDDAKTIAFTLSHELVHFIKKNSPSKFNTFANFLMEQYAEHGVDTSKILSNKMAELGTTDADFAYQEMICDACETMLLDSNAVVKLMELRKQDLGLFETIKLHILKLLNKIRDMYKSLGLEPTSDEAKALLKMEDVLSEIHSMFEDALVDATQNYQAVENSNKTIFGEATVEVGKTESGVKHQLKAHKEVGKASIAYNDKHKAVHKAILQTGVEAMYEMAEAMLPYLEQEGILPPDIPGKTIFKNGSYGKTGENTTLCVRTLTYEDFKDRVAEKVGRPLTVSESLLVSQKIYDIATEPQCIYCYVAADRKAYDEYLGEYWKAMDKYIKAMRKGGDSKALYTEYLAGRKDTDQQKKRWSQWEAIAKSGKDYITAKDLTTKRTRDRIIAKKNAFSEQIKDAQRYAQSASWAKTVCDYRAYKGDILKMTSKFVDMLNSEYGLRMYSFSDYTPAFIVENMQMIIDASVKGLKSLAYTKDTDYVEIFASTGQAINVSCFAKWDAESGTYVEDNRQGANWEKTKNLRKQYRNVGAVMVATNDAMVEWALKQDWVDVVIPYHIVKTGTTIANEYQWNNYTSESSDKIGSKGANIYPTEHNNDFATYSDLLKERGITPRFNRWYDVVAKGELTEDQYMKLVNEVRLPASELSPVVPSFNLEAAKKSFGIDNEGKVIEGGFVDKGGYMGGWYRQGVDVNQEVMAVSEDIEAGKSSLDVDYGMSKAGKEKVEARYKKQAKANSNILSDDGYSEYNLPITFDDVKKIHEIHKQSGEISVKRFNSEQLKLTQKWAYKFYNDIGIKSPFFTAWFGEWRAHQKDVFIDVLTMDRLDGKNPRGQFKNEDTGWVINSSSVGYDETNSHSGKDKKSVIAMRNIDKIIKNAVLFDTEVSHPGRGKKSIYTAFMHKFYAPISIDGKKYIAKMAVDESYSPGQKETNKKFYHVRSIEIETASSVGIGFNHTPIIEDTASAVSIADLYRLVKYYDKEFTAADDVSPSVMNDDGTPRMFDHTTEDGSSIKVFKNDAGQIKSAETGIDANIGIFDGNNSNIHYQKKKRNTDAIRGVYINDSTQAFTEQILNGEKTIETREQPKNRQYPELHKFVGERIGIVRSGKGKTMLVGFATVSDEIVYNTEAEFRADEDKHLVKKGSAYDIKTKKYGYVLADVERVTPWEIPKGAKRNGMSDVDINSYHNKATIKKQLKKSLEEREYTVAEIRELFNEWNTDKDLSALGEKVFAKLDSFIKYQEEKGKRERNYLFSYAEWPYTISFRNTDYIRKRAWVEKGVGVFSDVRNSGLYGITFDIGKFSELESDQLRAQVLLHEAIHAVTVRTLNEVEGLIPKGVWLGEYTPPSDWTEERKGAFALLQIFEQVRYDGHDKYYGEKSVQEMVAELSNPEFRQYLKKHSLWSRIIDAIKRILGIETGNVLDATTKALDRILDETPNSDLHFQKKQVTNRTLLANALDSIAQNDIEKNKLQQYKAKIALIESEQAKLAEIREKANELRFTKGRTPTETKQMRDLDFEANKIANRINTYDKQLMNLESTAALKGVLEREKANLRKRLEKQGKEALNAYKEKAAKTQRELITRYQESRKNAIESRNKTEMRRKIKKVVSDLNQLLLHGSKERNVKLGLQQAVAAALDAINMDTVGADERIAKYNALIAKAKDPDVIESLTATRDRIQAQGDSLGDKLKALKDAYYDIQHGEEGKDYPDYYKDEAALIELRIQSVIKEVGNTSLRNMSLKQLSDVYDMYKMVLTTIQNANSVWKEGKAEDLQQNASAVMAELEKLKKLKGEGTKLGEMIRSYSWNEMIPYYAFERIGSKTFTSFFWETIKGQDTYANDVSEAKGFADNTREKYGYKKWDLDKLYEFKLTDGRTFQVTLKHMLSIYAYSKRDQALPHMSTGGFFFNDKSTFRKKGGILELIKRDDEGYKIDANILAEIKGAMTKEQIKYVDEMQEYLTKMGEKGNEVTRVLWGIDIFKEQVYFPLKSKDDFIKRSTETAQSVSLKNDGMTKETVPGASNPIVLEAFDDVWASHIDRMSQYHAFVIPIDNLNKIHQYGTWSGTSSMSVSTMLTARFGSAVNEYISQFIKDLNGNVVNQGAKSPIIGLLNKFKKTAVGASLSTIVQQPTAILRAMSMVNAKYFVGKPNIGSISGKWEEVKKYAPIAIIKDIGGFDAGSGAQVSRWLNSDALTGADKVLNKIDDFSMWGAEFADKLGWTSIWEAVKRETKATKSLAVGSEAFLKKAGERFTEVIVKTQVYDSTLSRSGFMRSKSELVKMATAFMGEPTLSINMMFNAIISAVRGGSKAQAARTIAYTYASIIAASAMSSLIYALRDDDEDESYVEKYLQSFGGQLVDDVLLAPATSLPFVKDVASIFQGWEVERTDVAIFKDIKDAFDGLYSDNKSMYRKIEDLAGAFAAVFGVPLKNLLRTGREIYNAIKHATDGLSGGDLGGAFAEDITSRRLPFRRSK